MWGGVGSSAAVLKAPRLHHGAARRRVKSGPSLSTVSSGPRREDLTRCAGCRRRRRRSPRPQHSSGPLPARSRPRCPPGPVPRLPPWWRSRSASRGRRRRLTRRERVALGSPNSVTSTCWLAGKRGSERCPFICAITLHCTPGDPKHRDSGGSTNTRQPRRGQNGPHLHPSHVVCDKLI